MLTVKTNNKPRQLVYGYELTDKEKTDFDWMNPEDLESSDFFRYKGQAYALSEAQRLDGGPLSDKGWHGAFPDSYFSGVLVRLIDSDHIIVGRWYE